MRAGPEASRGTRQAGVILRRIALTRHDLSSISVLLLVLGCATEPAGGPIERSPGEAASTSAALAGVPVGGYPSYDERLGLVA